ncbi:hypothetical protein V3C99_000230 [Haemonchus contortus]
MCEVIAIRLGHLNNYAQCSVYSIGNDDYNYLSLLLLLRSLGRSWTFACHRCEVCACSIAGDLQSLELRCMSHSPFVFIMF